MLNAIDFSNSQPNDNFHGQYVHFINRYKTTNDSENYSQAL